MLIWLSHAAFSDVSCFVLLPSAETRKISAGAVIVDFSNTTKSEPGKGWEIVPPFAIILGAPPARGTLYRLCVPLSSAVNQIDRPSGEKRKSSTERSIDSNKVRLLPAGWSERSRYHRSDSKPD